MFPGHLGMSPHRVGLLKMELLRHGECVWSTVPGNAGLPNWWCGSVLRLQWAGPRLLPASSPLGCFEGEVCVLPSLRGLRGSVSTQQSSPPGCRAPQGIGEGSTGASGEKVWERQRWAWVVRSKAARVEEAGRRGRHAPLGPALWLCLGWASSTPARFTCSLIAWWWGGQCLVPYFSPCMPSRGDVAPKGARIPLKGGKT